MHFCWHHQGYSAAPLAFLLSDSGVCVFKKNNYIWVLAKIQVRNHKLTKGVGTLPMYDIQVWRGSVQIIYMPAIY